MPPTLQELAERAKNSSEPRFRPARPSELKLGARIEYRGSWGRGFPRSGEIIGGPELEGDEFVWDVRLDNGVKHWGYLEQFLINEAAP